MPLGAALVVTVAAESAVVAGGSRVIGSVGLVLVLLATAGWALVVSDARVEEHPVWVAMAIGTAYAISVAAPPRNSHDLWSYVMYGRMVSAHHLSPYSHVPIDFLHDPFLGRVAAGWRHTSSVYGPLFTGVSAALTRVAGDSALRARLAFQGLATIGVIATLAVIRRTTRSAAAVAFVGLHPVMVIVIVNGGHNDALVGLAVMAGALLVGRRRWYAAGFVIGLGMLVKVSAGLGLLGLVVWSFPRNRRGAAQLAVAAGVTTLLGYLPTGSAAVRVLAHSGNSNGNTRASVWDPISSALHPSTAAMLTLMLLLAVVAAFRWRADPRPASTALATLTATLVGGVYVLPWYPAWALPTAALDRRSRLSMLVAAQAAFLVAVYEFELPAHPSLVGAWAVVRSVLVQAGAWLALGLFIALLVSQRTRDRVAPTTPTAMPMAAPPSPRSCC